MPYSNRSVNHIHCACKDANCNIGIRSDIKPDVLIFSDKDGNDIVMLVNSQSINELIDYLQNFKKQMQE